MTEGDVVQLLERAQRQIDRLVAENADLRMQLRCVPKYDGRPLPRRHLDTAFAHAQSILLQRFAHVPATRRTMVATGLVEQREYRRAYALLKAAGLEYVMPSTQDRLDRSLDQLRSTWTAWSGLPPAGIRQLFRQWGSRR